MTIAVTDTSVIFTHGDRSHALPTNGTAITHDGLGGEVAISVAWTDGALVETHTTPHGTMTVTYTVSADGNRLTITRTVDPAADHGPADATHVWDRVTE